MDSNSPEQHTAQLALDRLLSLARSDNPHSRSVADFLIALHDGGDDTNSHTMDLLNVDAQIADDMLIVLRMVRESHRHPYGRGFREEVADAWSILNGSEPHR
jgi:hypothetical protein